MEYVATNVGSRSIDRYLMDEVGIDGIVLMECAARAVADAVLRQSGSIAVLIGGGNNGGDGLALMRILKLLGRDSLGILCCDEKKFSGDALKNYEIAVKIGLSLTHDIERLRDKNIIVDAIFGTGLDRNIEGTAYRAIQLANESSAYRIAVDIPSGINGDTGAIMGIVFRADETITVQCIKRGMLLTPEREAVGKLSVCKIGIIPQHETEWLCDGELIDEDYVRSQLPDRRTVSNKGTYGRSLIIGGSSGMSGAAVMAATAALRAGSGLVNACVPKEIVGAFRVRPEIMADSDADSDINALIEKASSIAVGCGSRFDQRIKEKLTAALASGKPCVIDADGLNNLDSASMELLHENCMLTPHPLEFARLLGCGINHVLRDPVGISKTFAQKHRCTLLLKSATTVIASPSGKLRYNISGNPGLAKGGSGDVLTGIITALLAQKLTAFDAACVGAFLLGSSADKALELLGNRALIAEDVIDAVALCIGNN